MTVKKQTRSKDQNLADELAARLDAGLIAPMHGDSPEMRDLLSTYARLQAVAGAPNPGFFWRLKRSILRGLGDKDRKGIAGSFMDLLTRANKGRLVPALFVLIVFFVVAGFVGLWWVDTLPQRVDEQHTIVVGQTRFAPDSDASVRVVVRDFGKGEPIPGASVKVSLKPAGGRAFLLYQGETDETGSLPVSFHVPADAAAQATLIVETRSAVGRDRVEQPVTIEREYRLLLASDKPLYQPGQVIHMRALALSALDLTPARGATVHFLVEDAKGNKVYRQDVVASDYGIAAADFLLADLVNQGNYKLSVFIGETSSEKTVEVRPYVLPKFGVEVTTDRSYYLPGQRVEGVVQADYFFGKPVTEGQVQIAGSVWDVERVVLVELLGETDENGTYEFGFDLPEYFAGSGLESGQAQFALEVAVVDQTDHPEQTGVVLPIADQPLIIEAVAESGVLKRGVENIIYILTSYPDGRPAQTELTIRLNGGELAQLTSGEFGLTQFAFTPQGYRNTFHILAQDEAGLAAWRQVDFEAETGNDSVLLRADRAAYVVGETMYLVALTPSEFGSVYLDIVKAGQTLSTRSTKVEEGRVEFAVDVTADLYGTLELHAYKVLSEGTIVRDTRIVVVDAPNDVAIDVSADKDTYLPGEAARLDFQTSDAVQGTGLQTALGLAVVDESVFALQRQDPGFAKLYFLLEQELMEPFYQVKGFELPAAIPPEEGEIRLAQDEATKAAWAETPALVTTHAVDSRREEMDRAILAQGKGFERIGSVSAVGLVFIPVALWAVVIVALRRAGFERHSLRQVFATTGVILLAAGCVAGWLAALRQSYYYFDLDLEHWGATLGIALIVGLLVFVNYAWARRDPAARFLTLLTLAWPAAFFLLVLVSERGVAPDWRLILTGVLAFSSIPCAYLIFGQTRWKQGRRVGALVTGLGGLSALPAMVILPVLVLNFAAGPPGSARMLLGERSLPSEIVLNLERRYRLDSPSVPFLDGYGFFAAVIPPGTEGRIDGDEAPSPPPTGGGQATGPEPPRLRQYFPETLYWAPEVVTDEDGFVSLEIPMADSITTWRLTALASSQDGRLGFTTRGVRVFQDFFVDVDLPVSLTQGDEISIPVGVFNYLPEAQEVRLAVEQEGWFELLGEGEQTLTIASNDIDVVYFPIRVREFGRQGFQVTAWGEQMSDAIRREVAVVPDGKEMRLTESDWLRKNEESEIEIPSGAVPRASRVEVKIYPGVMAQVVEGLEKILRLPHG